MKTKKLLLGLLPAFALTWTGCVSGPVGLSPSSEPLEPGSYTEIGPARGSVTTTYLLGFLPLGDSSAPALRAMNQAIRSSDADALVKISIDQRQQSCGILTLHHTDVNATAVKKGE